MAASTNPPNILWYCADAQRYDTIAALGNPHIRTPTLDRLVASGTAFRQAYCQAPICTPSRASFLTGRYPATTQVYRNGNAGFTAGEVLLTRLLADAGYDCGLAGKHHLTSSKAGERRYDDGYGYGYGYNYGYGYGYAGPQPYYGSEHRSYRSRYDSRDTTTYYGAYGRPDVVYGGGGSAYGQGRDPRRIDWCSRNYRSYDPRSGYYRAYSGRLVYCG